MRCQVAQLTVSVRVQRASLIRACICILVSACIFVYTSACSRARITVNITSKNQSSKVVVVSMEPSIVTQSIVHIERGSIVLN